MKVHFYAPPADKSTGGLDLAIRTIASHLQDAGVAVKTGLCHEDTADIVHFHGLWQPQHSAAAARCRRDGTPYVVSPHGMLEPWAWRYKRWKKWPYFLLRERRYLAGAGALLATAGQEAGHIRRFFPGQRIAEISLGLPSDQRPDYTAARQRCGWQADECILLFLSRVHEKKGLDLLIQSLADAELPPKCRLVVVGGGEPGILASLRQLVTQLGEALPQVDWAGEIWGDEKWDYLQGADLFCLTSHSENFGLAVLEACQVGTPVLTSTATPWGEFLNRDGGFVVAPECAAITPALNTFFAMPQWDATRRNALSQWAFETFDWDHLTRKYSTLYTQLTGVPAT